MNADQFRLVHDVEMVSVFGLALSVIGLGLAIWAIRLAFQTNIELVKVREITDDVHEVARVIQDQLATFEVRQSEALDELSESIATLQSAEFESGDVGQGAAPTEEPEPAGFTEASEYERMYPLSLSLLPDDIERAVTEDSGSDVVWALQRRGRGRARWLVGTRENGPWRVTRNRNGETVTEVPTFRDQVRPIPIEEMEAGAIDALLGSTGLTREDLGGTMFRRLGKRGVPVFYAVLGGEPHGYPVWRLVKTRWGWSAVPEID